MNEFSLCSALVFLVSVFVLIWGLLDLLRRKQADELTDGQTISRQLKGLGMVLLSNVVFILGCGLCVGLGGGVASMSKFLGRS
ncbi:MAG TPA: hypothetical protein VLE02_01845 [Nitrosarchaeum sp.]|nr:hypothetical protein [Nitrosarchaeum sp.]